MAQIGAPMSSGQMLSCAPARISLANVTRRCRPGTAASRREEEADQQPRLGEDDRKHADEAERRDELARR